MERWLDLISPMPHHCGTRLFPKGVINPWRVIMDFELFLVSEGEAEFVGGWRAHPLPGAVFRHHETGAAASFALPDGEGADRLGALRLGVSGAGQASAQRHLRRRRGGAPRNTPHSSRAFLLHGPLRNRRPLELHELLAEDVQQRRSQAQKDQPVTAVARTAGTAGGAKH